MNTLKLGKRIKAKLIERADARNKVKVQQSQWNLIPFLEVDHKYASEIFGSQRNKENVTSVNWVKHNCISQAKKNVSYGY